MGHLSNQLSHPARAKNYHIHFEGITGKDIFHNEGEISEPKAEALGEDVSRPGSQNIAAQ